MMPSQQQAIANSRYALPNILVRFRRRAVAAREVCRILAPPFVYIVTADNRPPTKPQRNVIIAPPGACP
jgi:hypothetical protein